MEKEAFAEQLRSAFPAERIDGKAAFESWGTTYLDAAEYARAIDGKTWEELDAKYLVRRNDALSFLSTRELVQVLPVYLRSLVEEGLWSPALDTVLGELTRPESAEHRERFDALLTALAPAQRELVAAVLQQIVELDPDGSPGEFARTALASWEKGNERE